MKRLIATTTLIFLLVTVIPPVFAEDNTVSLLSRLWSRDTEQQFVINEVLTPFEEENNCRVIFEVKSNDDLFKEVTAQTQSHNVTTDVVVVYCSLMQDWVESGYVVDLTEQTDYWKDRTFPQGLARMTIFDGKQYFLPIGADVYLFIANKRALQYLPDGVDIQNLTWKQVMRWSLAVADGEGEGKFAVTGAPQQMFIYQYGGMLLSYGGKFPTINSPEAIQVWELLINMQDAYTSHILEYRSVVEPMKQGEAWLAFAHCARVGDIYRSNPSQYVIAPAPKGPVGIGSIAGTSGLGILQRAPHKELAVKLVEYMSRPEIQLKIAKGAGGFIPPVEEAIKLLDGGSEDKIIHKALRVMDKGVLAFIPSMFGETWNSVKLIYEDAFKKLVLEDGAIDKTYLDNAQEEIDALEVEGLLLKSTSTIRSK